MTFGDTCKQEKKIEEKEKDPTPPTSVSGAVPIVLGSSTVKSSYAEWLTGMQIHVHVWTHTSMCAQVYTYHRWWGRVWKVARRDEVQRYKSVFVYPTGTIFKYRNLQRKRVLCHS